MKAKLLTTKQAALFLGLGSGWEAALVRLRTDSTRRWDRRGPPFLKLANEDCTTSYYYGKKSLEDWAKYRLLYLTAGDVGLILGYSRFEISNMHGIRNHTLKKGELIIDAKKNIYFFKHKNYMPGSTKLKRG